MILPSRFKRYFRGARISIFVLSIPLSVFAASTDQSAWFYVASILTWSSLGAFCYTEGFWFKSPARTKLNAPGSVGPLLVIDPLCQID